MSMCTYPECKKEATWIVRRLERDGTLVDVDSACWRHAQPDRRNPGKRGPLRAYRLGVPQCSATLRNGWPCDLPAWFRVTRLMSGVTAMNCHLHVPGGHKMYASDQTGRWRQQMQEAGIASIEDAHPDRLPKLRLVKSA